MSKCRFVAAVTLTAALLTAASPAQAQHLSLPDEAGDTISPGLDITNVTVMNRDRAVVATLTFERDRRAAVVLGVDARHRGGVALIVSEHPREGQDRLRLYTTRDPNAACPGLASHWNRAAATVKFRLPSECLVRGNYGAIRFRAVTEGYRNNNSTDVDFAPDKPPDSDLPFTKWVPRG